MDDPHAPAPAPGPPSVPGGGPTGSEGWLPAPPRGTTPSEDSEHLRLLSIFHYVVGALAGLFALLPSLHLLMGLWMASGAPMTGPPAGGEEEAFLRLMGGFMSAVAGGLIALGLAFAGCLIAAGRFLATRTHYTFCLVVAGIACTFFPFGTVLGVFTILVLMRPSVKALFGSAPAGG